MNDLISIVLPVYNGEKYLRESINSIIAQTYENWELLILDDCSTDNSSVIAKEYEKNDNRIHYYRNEKNLRLPRNLNRGFSLSKGNYLTWTSDDNCYKPTALEKMYNALKESDTAQLVFASYSIIDEEGIEINQIIVDSNSKKTILGSDCVGACFLYTRKVYEEVGDYDPEYTLVEDFDYWQRVFAKFDVIEIKEVLYEYRHHSGALTSTMKKEIFKKRVEKVLLKNRPAFGKLDLDQNYYYYYRLYDCRKSIGDKNNPYKAKYYFYFVFFFVRRILPSKIKRILKF